MIVVINGVLLGSLNIDLCLNPSNHSVWATRGNEHITELPPRTTAYVHIGIKSGQYPTCPEKTLSHIPRLVFPVASHSVSAR
jgi:hypothetical protein